MNSNFDQRERDLDPSRDARTRAVLVQFAADTIKPSRRKHRRLILVLVPVIAAGALTAGAFAVFRPVTNQNTVNCFARAEIDIWGSYPGAGVATAEANGGPVPISDAIQACTQVWQDGLLSADQKDGAPATPTYNTAHNSPVPAQLTVCVMRDGSAAVIPGPPSVCSQLGLASRTP